LLTERLFRASVKHIASKLPLGDSFEFLHSVFSVTFNSLPGHM